MLLVIWLIHFSISRTVRTEIFSKQVTEVVYTEPGVLHPEISVLLAESRVLNISYSGSVGEKILRYKIPFGFFFIVAVTFLIAGGKYKESVILVLIHLITLMICSALIGISLSSVPVLFYVIDLFTVYLIPLCSLGLVALAYIQPKEKAEE